MDVSFNNVLEGTRQYFMGVPKTQEGSGQSMWPSGTPPEEGTPAMSGAPAPSSRPPSAAAAPPSTPTPTPVVPPRPPSEPIEPEPHIIHKATVMREAAEKRREQPDVEDEEEPVGAISPPSHIIRKPTPHTLPSPAPAPGAPCPSPARPPSSVPIQQSQSTERIKSPQYRTALHQVQTSMPRSIEDFSSGRPPDLYPSSRPPDAYGRYQYEPPIPDSSRSVHGPPVPSPQPSTITRHSPQTYSRISSSMSQHTVHRLSEPNRSSPPAQRYPIQNQTSLPHNDRVPPIYHPQVLPPTKRITTSSSVYASLPQRREQKTSVPRPISHFERHPPLPQRKYDHQHTYSGYRPNSTSLQSNMATQRMEQHQALAYKHSVPDSLNSNYSSRSDRTSSPMQSHPQDPLRVHTRMDYMNKSGPLDSRNSYHYSTPSTSSSRYHHPSPSVPVAKHNSPGPVRTSFRPTVTPKSNHSYSSTNYNNILTSPSRSSIKSGYQNQHTRMTVSVTSLVNEMNQTKQKRESPLDLSVKTVKNSADSSTTQDDTIDSVSIESKSLPLQPRQTSSNSHVLTDRYAASHKVDFAPDFAVYRERVRYATASQQCNQPQRYNVALESCRAMSEVYPVESRQHVYPERANYNSSVTRNEYVPRIDLTRTITDERLIDSRRREDGRIEERKRSAGSVVTSIPEKNIRREGWQVDNRERLSQSAREQRDLMSRPVYDYTSHKKLEAYQYDMKQSSHSYHDSRISINQTYTRGVFPIESSSREVLDYHNNYQDRYVNRHIIQKTSHRDVHQHHHLNASNAIPQAEKSKVLSILRSSLETRQSACSENVKPNTISELIVIDDIDDPVIEITDLTKENEREAINKNLYKVNGSKEPSNLGSHIQMPRAVDSIQCDADYQRLENTDAKSKSPEIDVASRIRTKAELKVMPPSQDAAAKLESRPNNIVINNVTKEKCIPKSQKQHLFNRIREDSLRLGTVIIKDDFQDVAMSEVKSEPMNIEEIEKDAILSIKIENNVEENSDTKEVTDSLDMDWATACDSFMEQLQTDCHKKKVNETDPLNNQNTTVDVNSTDKIDEVVIAVVNSDDNAAPIINIKQEPVEEEDTKTLGELSQLLQGTVKLEKDASIQHIKVEKLINEKAAKSKSIFKNKYKKKMDSIISPATKLTKKEKEKSIPIKSVIKEEAESTDDDEPLIKSKLLKEKEKSEQLKYQMLKDLSAKSAIVKLECCDGNTRKSIECTPKERDDKQIKPKQQTRSSTRSRSKLSIEINNAESSTESEEDSLSLTSRLRTRKKTKLDDKVTPINKTPVKSSLSKKVDNSSASNSSTPARKSGFGDGSDFHPGWEEELYKYKRSLRMPSRLIAIPKGRSGGKFVKDLHFARGSTSLPDLDPVPLSPAPSSAPSVVTDDLYRRPEKTNLDSDLESNSSYSTPNRLQYDSEASTSTVISSNPKKNRSSIVDELIKKCGSRDSSKKKCKDKEEKTPKTFIKSSTVPELLPTPSLGLVKNGHKGNLGGKKEKILEDIFYLGAFRKETVTAFRDAFIKDTDGLIGATEEFAPLMLKSRTRTESRVLKQRATMKEVFGDDRPASAPPTSCREEDTEEKIVEIKKEPEAKPKMKQKITKDKFKRRSSSIRDGLRSTALKRNDAKGRMMRLKKRNSLLKNISGKRMKEMCSKPKKEKSPLLDQKSTIKEESTSIITTETTKKRFKRLFGRRKLSSGFDYIRKKKKPIRKAETVNKVRRLAPKPSPESVHDIQKEIKGWFINKSIGETHLHRAARLGFTDCVAYCLEKMESDPSAKDNAGFTPLHVAASKGHVRIARLLLQYGANVSAAAQGGIRPLHEACESSHVEVIRLLLSYGADPLLGTYAGQTPEELAEGTAATFIRLYVADVQGMSLDPWRFPPPNEVIDREETGCEPLSSPPPASPPPTSDATIEIQCTDTPLPPFYSLRTATGQPADGLWCLLQDVTNILQIKSKESLLKQIHCGSGSPKELLREIRTQEFLERAQCHQLLCAGEKVNIRASKVALIRVTDKLRQLLKIETILVS